MPSTVKRFISKTTAIYYIFPEKSVKFGLTGNFIWVIVWEIRIKLGRVFRRSKVWGKGRHSLFWLRPLGRPLIFWDKVKRKWREPISPHAPQPTLSIINKCFMTYLLSGIQIKSYKTFLISFSKSMIILYKFKPFFYLYLYYI